MSPFDLVAFSGRALRGHRLRTALSLLGVAIGVASVIVLTSLGEGARLYVTGEFSALGSNLLIVIPGRTETTGAAPIFGGAQNDITLDDAQAVRRQVRQARRVAPIVVGTTTLDVGGLRREVVVAGTTPDLLAVRKIHLRSGFYLPSSEASDASRVIVLGATIAAELFPGRTPLGAMVRLGDERFRVVGVMAPRGVSLGENLDEVVHIPIAASMRLFNRQGIFRLLVEVNAFDEIESARREVIRVFAARHDGVEDVTVLTQDAVLSAFSRILSILTAALAGIAAISLSVAGIGIMNVMLVSVSERIREIGLLKALGASRGQVLLAFLVEATLLAIAGGLTGLALGLGAARALTWVYPAFPAQPPVWAVLGALALSALVGIAFGTLPARRAARLDPVAALARR